MFRTLRLLGFLEGLSLLVLLGIAMPLKHLAGEPLLVRIVGWIHGILFLAFCLALVRVVDARGWPLSRGFAGFVAALLPGGTFVFDRRVRAWQAEGAAPTVGDRPEAR